jgi:KUP system potassium uptake protein
VIASQAVISGTYSLTRQAMNLGYAPRIQVEHTSVREEGQIYLPSINWTLLLVTVLLVIGFGSSTRLAAAYGIAVTTTMVITTLLAHVVARRVWHWRMIAALPLTACLLVVDLSFLGANALKIADGGWVPLAMAMAVFVLMSTWKRGREILAQRLAERTIAWDELPAFLASASPTRVPGTAVYMTGRADRVPPALIENLRHNRALHDNVIFLSIHFTQLARVSVAKRVKVDHIAQGFVRVQGYYGFVEQPDVPKLLELALAEGIEVDMETTTFVLGRETLLATERPGMAMWRETLFAFMSRNARRAASFFRIPSERVLEIGSQIEL